MDKGTFSHTKKAKVAIVEKNMSWWEKQRAEFFATNPKCKECGADLVHYSRTMICTNCQNARYRKSGWRNKGAKK